MTDKRYQANIITKTKVDPTDPYETTPAPGVWSLSEALGFKKANKWPTVGNVETDPNFADNTALFHFDGTEGQQNRQFLDRSNNAVTLNLAPGDPTQGSFSPYSTPDGYWSIYHDGTETGSSDSYVTAGSHTFSGDFTIEFWWYRGNQTLGGRPFGIGGTELGSGLYAYEDGSSLAIGNGEGGGNNGAYVTVSGGLSNKWVHIAIVRNGTDLKVYANGTQTHNWTQSTTITGTLTFFRYSYNSTLYGSGPSYLSNFRVLNGTALYTSAFTPPTSPLSSITNTSTLAAQSNRFINNESSGASIIPVYGSAGYYPSIQAFSPFDPTGAYSPSPAQSGSVALDGVGDSVYTSDITVGTGNFTLECWVFFRALTDNATIATFNNTALQLYYRNASSNFALYDSGGAKQFTGFTPKSGEWMHLAFVRSGSTVTLYVNGTSINSVSSSEDGTGPLRIGAYGSSNIDDLPGYVSNLRVSNTALYSSNFTPPTADYTVGASTILLTCQDGFYDASSNNERVTPQNQAKMSTFYPFAASDGYWGMRLDGSQSEHFNYDDPALNIGTADFTFEYWQFPLLDSQRYGLHASSTSTGNYGLSHNVSTFYWGDGTAWTSSLGTGSRPKNEWTHYAFTRESGTIRVFNNGVLQGTYASDTTNIASEFIRLGGQLGTSQRFDGVLSNARLVVGTAVYTSNFTVPTTPLTAVTNTQLLVFQSKDYKDNSSNDLSPTSINNTPLVTMNNPFVQDNDITTGAGSLYLDGASEYLEFTNNDLLAVEASEDYTFECWAYPIAYSNTPAITAIDTRDTTGYGIGVGYNVTSTNRWFSSTGDGNITASGTTPWNAWTHIAQVRDNGTQYLFVNGQGQGSMASTSAFDQDKLTVGEYGISKGTYNFNGWITDVRFTKGEALYDNATGYTPNTSPLRPTENTSVLLSMANGAAYDNAVKHNAIFKSDARIVTSEKKFGTGSLSLLNTADHVQLPRSDHFKFNLGDFTAEAWIYLNGTDQTYRTIFGFDATGSLLFQIYQMKLDFGVRGTSSSQTTNTVPNDQWTHVAITRASGTAYWFIDGNLEKTDASYASSLNFGNNTVNALIGDYSPGTTNFNGYIDDLRITRGVARYTSSFTPPTKAFIDR